LHNMSNDNWTWYEPHLKRGTEAMNAIGIIPLFTGILVHDHWKPYYTYNCNHSLCNAHHLRELTRSFEQDGQSWAEKMHAFLLALNNEVIESWSGKLSKEIEDMRRQGYQKILSDADIECPPPDQPENTKRRPKRSKSRNLLERLRDYENDVLSFMINPIVPFTNNMGERDIRMIKVQQKISGCFRSMDGAVNFCKIRSYLSTCRKNGVNATDALDLLFNKKLPDFIQVKIDLS
jgi:transposase